MSLGIRGDRGAVGDRNKEKGLVYIATWLGVGAFCHLVVFGIFVAPAIVGWLIGSSKVEEEPESKPAVTADASEDTSADGSTSFSSSPQPANIAPNFRATSNAGDVFLRNISITSSTLQMPFPR